MVLERLGIVGWQVIEPVLLAALVSDSAILLIGRHGTNKTNGFKQIAKSLLRNTTKARRYNTPTLQIDDFMGYPDPAALAKGELKYIPTDMSIWEADAALFDEISRANPGTSNKLLEAVWEKTVHGMRTELNLVMTTMNPPGAYHSMYLDPALASRFVSVYVPDTKTMEDQDITEAIGFRLSQMKEKNHKSDPILRELVDKARMVSFSDKDRQQTNTVILKICKALHEKTEVYWSVRQAQIAASMLEASEAIRIAAREMGLAPNWSNDVGLQIILSTIPDAFGIVKGSNAGLKAKIESAITDILVGYECKDPLVMADNLDELIEADHPDKLIHASTICSALEKETDPDVLQDAIAKLRMTNKFDGEQLKGMIKVAMTQLVDMRLALSPTSPYIPSQVADIVRDAYSNDANDRNTKEAQPEDATAVAEGSDDAE